MKKIFFVAVIVISANISVGQPWFPENNGNGPVKFQDIINGYHNDERKPSIVSGHEPEGALPEGNDYLFGRWSWYWNQHLDENGYMVSPVKTYNEWSDYLKIHGKEKLSERTTSSTSNWVFQGPDHSAGGYSGIGRINTVAFHPTDPNTFYIGSAGGGAWKTNDGGNTWSPMYGNLPTLGVSDIKVNPLNPNTIYVCTGDKDGRDNFSIGVIKSTDGGVTWTNTGLSWSVYNYNFARSLLINPVDTNSLILATNVGIYKTYNGGTTWTNVSSGNFEQILYNNSDTNILYGTNYLSGYSSQILRSLNGGATWTASTTLTNVSRINIATCAASDTTVMAIAANNNSGLQGIYCSVDAGASYVATFTNDPTNCVNNLLSWDMGLPSTVCNGQGWYDLCIAVDPTNPNNVIVGGVNHYYSSDGGYHWTIATQWYTSLPGIKTVHADKHWLGYNPLNNALYATCDGGVYSTLDPISGLWNDHTNGLGITEFYRIAVADGVSFCLGGAQDNGTKMVNGGVYTDIRGGDGMQCQIDYTDPSNIWYASYYNGTIDATMNGGAYWTTISDAIPDSIKGDWVTPYIIHPTQDNKLLVGYDKLFYSSDYGTSWAAISPQFSTNYKINNIAVAPSNTDYIYLVLDDNSIRFSPDFGLTWSIIPPCSTTAVKSHLTIDPNNENIIWVTFSGYVASAKVYQYNRLTNVWTHVNGTLPNIPVNCLIIDNTTGTKYIATETTVFYMDTTMSDWALYNINLPAVIVNDLKINYATNELWAGTYGRGIWKTQKADHTNAVPLIGSYARGLEITPNPTNGKFRITSADGNLKNQSAIIKIYNVAGKVVWQVNSEFDDSGVLDIITSGLNAGDYVCQIQLCKFTFSKKLIIAQ